MDTSAELERRMHKLLNDRRFSSGKKKERRKTLCFTIQPRVNKNINRTREAQSLPLAFFHKTFQAGPSVCGLCIATQGNDESCQNGTFTTCRDGNNNNAPVQRMHGEHCGTHKPLKRLPSLPLLPTTKLTLDPKAKGPRLEWHMKFFRVMLSTIPASLTICGSGTRVTIVVMDDNKNKNKKMTASCSPVCSTDPRRRFRPPPTHRPPRSGHVWWAYRRQWVCSLSST